MLVKSSKINVMQLVAILFSYIVIGSIVYGEHLFLLPLHLIAVFFLSIFFFGKSDKPKNVFIPINALFVISMLISGFVSKDFVLPLLYIIATLVVSSLAMAWVGSERRGYKTLILLATITLIVGLRIFLSDEFQHRIGVSFINL